MTSATAPNLWTAARSWLADIASEFGGPASIVTHLARQTRAALKRQLKALETVVLKALLVEAAQLDLGPPGPSPATTARGAACGKRGEARLSDGACLTPDLIRGKAAPSATSAAACDTTDPDSWRVSFPLRIPAEHIPHAQRRGQGPRIRALGPPTLMTDVWRDNARRVLIARIKRMRDPLLAHASAPAKALRLARRFEALRRVFADSRPYALRLARKLAALGAAALNAARAIATAHAPRIASRAPVQVHAIFGAFRALPRYGDTS